MTRRSFKARLRMCASALGLAALNATAATLMLAVPIAVFAQPTVNDDYLQRLRASSERALGRIVGFYRDDNGLCALREFRAELALLNDIAREARRVAQVAAAAGQLAAVNAQGAARFAQQMREVVEAQQANLVDCERRALADQADALNDLHLAAANRCDRAEMQRLLREMEAIERRAISVLQVARTTPQLALITVTVAEAQLREVRRLVAIVRARPPRNCPPGDASGTAPPAPPVPPAPPAPSTPPVPPAPPAPPSPPPPPAPPGAADQDASSEDDEDPEAGETIIAPPTPPPSAADLDLDDEYDSRAIGQAATEAGRRHADAVARCDLRMAAEQIAFLESLEPRIAARIEALRRGEGVPPRPREEEEEFTAADRQAWADALAGRGPLPERLPPEDYVAMRLYLEGRGPRPRFQREPDPPTAEELIEDAEDDLAFVRYTLAQARQRQNPACPPAAANSGNFDFGTAGGFPRINIVAGFGRDRLDATGIGFVRDGAPGATPERFAVEAPRVTDIVYVEGGIQVPIGRIAPIVTFGYAEGDTRREFTIAAGGAGASGVVYGDNAPSGSSGIATGLGLSGEMVTETVQVTASVEVPILSTGSSTDIESRRVEELPIAAFRPSFTALAILAPTVTSRDYRGNAAASGGGFSFGQTRDQEIDETRIGVGLGGVLFLPLGRDVAARLAAEGLLYYRDTDLTSTERNQCSFCPLTDRDFTLNIEESDNGWGFRGRASAGIEFRLLPRVALTVGGSAEYLSSTGTIFNPNSGDQVFFDNLRTALRTTDAWQWRAGAGVVVRFGTDR